MAQDSQDRVYEVPRRDGDGPSGWYATDEGDWVRGPHGGGGGVSTDGSISGGDLPGELPVSLVVDAEGILSMHLGGMPGNHRLAPSLRVSGLLSVLPQRYREAPGQLAGQVLRVSTRHESRVYVITSFDAGDGSVEAEWPD